MVLGGYKTHPYEAAVFFVGHNPFCAEIGNVLPLFVSLSDK